VPWWTSALVYPVIETVAWPGVQCRFLSDGGRR